MLFISLIDIKLFQQNAHMFGGEKALWLLWDQCRLKIPYLKECMTCSLCHFIAQAGCEECHLQRRQGLMLCGLS